MTVSKSQKQNFLKVLLLMAVIFSILPSISLAQTNAKYNLLAPLPCIPGNGVTCDSTTGVQVESQVDFKQYFQYAFNLIIALAAVAAVLMIVWGGFEYMLSSSPMKMGDGLSRVKNAIYGLLLILGSYLILRTINPALVAIPNTLVPQLSLKAPSLTNSFFSDMSAAVAQKKAEVATINKSISDLETQARILEESVGRDDPKYKEIQRQIAEKQGQIQDIETETVVQPTSNEIDKVVSAVNLKFASFSTTTYGLQASVDKVTKLALDAIEAQTIAATSALQTLGSYDYSVVENKAAYSKALVQLSSQDTLVQNTVLKKYYGETRATVGSDISTTLRADQYKKIYEDNFDKIKLQISEINDPALKSDALAKLENSRSQMESKFK